MTENTEHKVVGIIPEKPHILVPKTLCKFEEKNYRIYFFYFSFITGSYDRTCKVWDTGSGEELHTLDGHRKVVYAIGFNNPYG